MLLAVLLSLIGTILYLLKLRQRAATAPRLTNLGSGWQAGKDVAKISVIIPAYNEAENIEACITSVLKSSTLSPEYLEVWVVDDQSTDETLAIAQSLQHTLGDQRLHILPGQSRPENQVWMGKNWACAQGAEQATGEFLLFLDADVRLNQGAIESAVQIALKQEADLLTFCPQIVCGCLAEWLVQPLMIGILAAGFDFNEVNDPKTDTAFAAGPFMLFRRPAYEQLGGHRSVADQVVEDVELARRIKAKGLRMYYAVGPDLASVRMYNSLQAVWEGWTKNWHLGSRRDLKLSLYSAISVLLICVIPWLAFGILLLKLWLIPFNWLDSLALVFTLLAIALQYEFRRVGARLSGIPPRYWWLTGIGGALVAAIAIASIIKTETGWGWTWRGRALRLPEQ